MSTNASAEECQTATVVPEAKIATRGFRKERFCSEEECQHTNPSKKTQVLEKKQGDYQDKEAQG